MKKVEEYLVVQQPKQAYRGSHVTLVVVVYASSMAEAVRMALSANGMAEMSDDMAEEYKKPQAQLFKHNRVYVI